MAIQGPNDESYREGFLPIAARLDAALALVSLEYGLSYGLCNTTCMGQEYIDFCILLQSDLDCVPTVGVGGYGTVFLAKLKHPQVTPSTLAVYP